MSTPNNNNNNSSNNNKKRQRITFVRHGRTYMNEYLATPGSQWGDSEFTDIFTDLLPTEEINHKYRDSILSPHGITQAKEMSKRLLSKTKKEGSDEVREISFLSDVDLIITSPLTRTIQTTELGLLPFFEQQEKENLPKIIASPLATERVYLISDLGQPISELKKKYPWIDFETGFNTCSGTTMTTHDPEKWWFTCDDEGSEENNTAAYYTYYDTKNTYNNNKEEDEEAPSMVRKTYKEWRPNSENQKYFCLGEPDDYFEARMYSLVQFITSLTATYHYQNVVLVCHWGVIDYLIGQDFENCQVQTFDLEDVVSYLKKKNT